jgi:hypothetical protein
MVSSAASFARLKAGNSRAARIAITTRSSMRVNAASPIPRFSRRASARLPASFPFMGYVEPGGLGVEIEVGQVALSVAEGGQVAGFRVRIEGGWRFVPVAVRAQVDFCVKLGASCCPAVLLRGDYDYD